MNFRNSSEIQSLTQIVGAAPSIYERRDQVRYDDFLRVVTRVLKKTVDKMLLDIKSRHQPPTTNNRFVHYTSISTLVSLLEKSGQGSNGYLRLYDSAHFNDPDEGRYLERYSEGSLDCIGITSSSHKHAYITSFVPDKAPSGGNNRDNLVFWRAYGDDGQGCSIEISFPAAHLSKVLYGRDPATETIKILDVVAKERLPIIRDCINPLMEIGDERNIVDTKNIIERTILNEIESIKYLYKSEAYDYEQEYRFIMTETEIGNANNGEVKFEYNDTTKGRKTARHYYEHEELSTRNILATGAKITLGPTAEDRYSLKLYLEDLLKKARLGGPKIECSKIPYRVK